MLNCGNIRFEFQQKSGCWSFWVRCSASGWRLRLNWGMTKFIIKPMPNTPGVFWYPPAVALLIGYSPLSFFHQEYFIRLDPFSCGRRYLADFKIGSRISGPPFGLDSGHYVQYFFLYVNNSGYFYFTRLSTGILLVIEYVFHDPDSGIWKIG